MRPVARAILKRKIFKKPITDYLAGTIKWSDPSLKNVKRLIREVLRVEQNETCPYCQRLIVPERRNATEHIEHYLDKSREAYRKFAFTSTNLLLSCHGCNIEKSTRDLVIKGKAKPTYLSSAESPFRWPHPYYDSMTACVLKRRGPVYSAIPGSGREVEAAQMIADLKLDTIRSVESRHSRLLAEQERILEEMQYILKKNIAKNNNQFKELLTRLQSITNDLY